MLPPTVLPHHDGLAAASVSASSSGDSAVITTTTHHHHHDPVVVASATHLDDLESSDQVDDISSFQDVELPPPSLPSDVDDSSSVVDSVYDEHGRVRRPKRFYYLRPMMQRYKFWIAGFALAASLLLVAIGLSASRVAAAAGKNDAMMMAEADDDRGDIVVNDAPHPPPIPEVESIPTTTTTTDDVTGEGEWEGEGKEAEAEDVEVGDGTDIEDPNLVTQPPRPSPPSSPSPPTSSASSSSSAVAASWDQTTGTEYQTFLDMGLQDLTVAMEIATLFCISQDMALCTYDAYCPDGAGGTPYSGGPPSSSSSSHTWNSLEETQWAPFYSPSDDDVDGGGDGGGVVNGDWVQVGIIPDYEGGDSDNGYGRCYRYSIWNPSSTNSNSSSSAAYDIEDYVTEEHRRWILCCRDR